MTNQWPPKEWIEEDKKSVKDLERTIGFLASVEYDYRYSMTPGHQSMCKLIKEDIEFLLKENKELEGMIKSYGK